MVRTEYCTYGEGSYLGHSEYFLDALIGGAVSLVGGLFGRSDAKKRDKAAAEAAKVPVVTDSDTSHTVDLPGLVAAAEASGFNPMTILNAGGLSAFTSTKQHTVTTGQNAMAAVPTAPSVGSVIAQSVGNAFQIYREDKAAAQTAALSAFPPAPVSSRGIMSVIGGTSGGYAAQGGRVNKSQTGALSSGSGHSAVLAGNSLARDPAKPGAVLNLPFLGDVTLSKRSPAQIISDELGDGWDFLAGGGRIAESLDLNKYIGRPPTMADALALGTRKMNGNAAAVAWTGIQDTINAAKAVFSQYGENRGAAIAGATMGKLYQPPAGGGGW
jgi:hypothetical protein